ncbi:MAG: hypothetical protein Ct9H300mP1_13050 [Planctomycetaceae bacterium]|nr:MAG: hypothetical protein Ct9H300mP1_13050 [Planctomycetaceae bacterium]
MATTDGCFSWLTLRIAFVSSCLFCGNAVAANLVPDPGFASVSELGAKADSKGGTGNALKNHAKFASTKRQLR